MVERDSRCGCRNMRVRVLPFAPLATKMTETVACMMADILSATEPRDYMCKAGSPVVAHARMAGERINNPADISGSKPMIDGSIWGAEVAGLSPVSPTIATIRF